MTCESNLKSGHEFPARTAHLKRKRAVNHKTNIIIMMVNKGNIFFMDCNGKSGKFMNGGYIIIVDKGNILFMDCL